MIESAEIRPDQRVAWTVARLFAPAPFSGWGIRTLSSAHPAYAPLSYHRGSVWSVETPTMTISCAAEGRSTSSDSLHPNRCLRGSPIASER